MFCKIGIHKWEHGTSLVKVKKYPPPPISPQSNLSYFIVEKEYRHRLCRRCFKKQIIFVEMVGRGDVWSNAELSKEELRGKKLQSLLK